MRERKRPERGQYPSGVYGALDYGAALERYLDWLEKDHQRLRDTNYSLLKQLGDKDVEIKKLKEWPRLLLFLHEESNTIELSFDKLERLKQVLK